MTEQLDFFAPTLVPGLATASGIVSPDEEAELIARIDAEALSPFRYHGWLGKRLTHSFGWSYDFEDGKFARADPIPDWLLLVRPRAAGFAQVPVEDLVQALLIRYDPGAGIGWHKDRPVFEHVIGVSLGAPATLRLRRRQERGFQRLSLPLEPRSVYHLSGEVRHDWQHGIAPMEATRWSITFRTVAQHP